MSQVETESTFVTSALITGIVNLVLFAGDLLEWYSVGLSFPAFVIEFCLGLIFFFPTTTKEIARGIIAASSMSLLVGLATCSYITLVQ